ncbi:MAG TPA: SAM-dependent methyltransferase [Thermoleophilaceae bacterium]|nr:SAM-dependent methyltransferase [Thermoleophilaceae bacterium]
MILKRPTKKEKSVTAETTAWLRAVGAREPDAVLRNPDHLAHELLGPRMRALGRVPGGWRIARRGLEAFAPGYYEYELARTKHIDAVLRDELAAGIDQLVLVGSGFDSRVYRFAEELAGVRAFEVDREVMLEQKRRRAVKRGFDGGATQVPLDLNLHTPLEALRRHGYDGGARTLFICSGVLMYLDPTAVERLLAFVAASGEGSSIVFDFLYAAAIADPESHYGAQRMLRNVERAREPYQFCIDPPELEGLLERQGLELVSHAGPAELNRAYVRRADGSQRGRICEYGGIAHARRRPAR